MRSGFFPRVPDADTALRDSLLNREALSSSREPPLRIGIGLAGLQFGGCQINALDLAMELTRRGHEVVAFAIYDSPLISVAPLADKLGIPLHILPAEKNPFLQSRHVAEFVSDHRLNVVHVFGAWLAAPTTIALRSVPETALVVTNWTMDNFWGLPPMTPLILGTESLREEASRTVRSAPVWLLEPPVDTTADQHDERARAAFRDKWSVSGTATLLVIVSRLDFDMKAEGIADAIRAMGVSPDSTHQLAVVGGGDAQHTLSQLADEVNTALGRRAVVMTGPLEDPSAAYSAADLVLGMGGAALRALAFQKPLVVLGEGGFSKPFTPGTVGYFLREGFYGRGSAHDPVKSLHTSIVSTLALSQSSDLAHWGRQILLSRFSLAQAADRLLTMYDIALQQTTSFRRTADATYVSARYLAGRSRRALQVVTRISKAGSSHGSAHAALANTIRNSRGRFLQVRRIVAAEGLTGLRMRILRRSLHFASPVQEPFPLFRTDIADSASIQRPALTHPADVRKLSIGWIMTPPAAGSGGHTTLFRLIEGLERAGHNCHVFLYDRFQGDVRRHAATIAANWPRLRAQVHDASSGLPALDGWVATSWQTAHVLASHPEASGARFYLVQDFEPYFYPRGSMYSMAEDTYRFGFTGITAGRWLAEKLEREFGMRCDFFEFGADRDVYFPLPDTIRDGVAFYTKPTVARRGHELGMLALASFHELRPDAKIHIYGDSPEPQPFPFVDHGKQTPEGLNKIYNSCRVGLSLSFTNVSLVPWEMLASGTVPVVNDADHNRTVLDNGKVVWAHPSPDSIALAMDRAYDLHTGGRFSSELSNSTANASWRLAAERVRTTIETSMSLHDTTGPDHS